MSDNIIKFFSAIILAIVVFINSIGNFIGVGDIIPTDPAEEPTTTVTETAFDEEAAAEFLEFLNAETAKIAEEGSYNFEREAYYTEPIDVGGATATLNAIISGIDEDSNLNSVVGYFLGIGVKKAKVPHDSVDNKYMIKATELAVSDITAFEEDDGVYTFTIKDATNPKNGTAGISNFTNDFITHEEVVGEISALTNLIQVKDSTAEYTNINVEVVVKNGKITSIEYSYDFDAEISLKAVIEITGTGATKTETSYTNIEY